MDPSSLTEKDLTKDETNNGVHSTSGNLPVFFPLQDESAFNTFRNTGLETSMVFVEHDFETGTTRFSKSFTDLLGYASTLVPDVFFLFHDIVHPDDRQQVTKYWEESIGKRESSALTVRLRRSDGSDIWANMGFLPALNKDGLCTKITLVINNIETAKKGHELLLELQVRYNKLFEKNLELQKLNLELENFVYHSSHDLKSPLKSVLGLVNILKLENDHVSQLDCINMIEGSIKGLDKLVNDLLSLSRNSRINDNLQPVNFMVELNHTISNLYHTSDTKNLEIYPLVLQPFPFVADLTRIRIVLNNLISNAFKYRSYNKKVSYVRIEVRVERERARLSIEDNGIGIAQSKQERVFDMFYRASESSDGSGLGLYIVRNVLNKINGTISLTSVEGVGSTFTVEIPNHWTSE